MATTLAFELAAGGPVRLEIFAVDGRRIRSLVDAVRTAGRHEVVWQGRDSRGRAVASGTYFYRMQAGDFQALHKMIVIK